jgi:hypothetical protein
LGHLLTQQLLADGERVVDVQPKLAARVRLLNTGAVNKNDPNDARSVAVAALRSSDLREVVVEDQTAVLRLWARRIGIWAAPGPNWCAGCTRCCASWCPAGSPRRSPPAKPLSC